MATTTGFIDYTDQGSAPTTPDAGHSRVFTKSDGAYVVDDAGAVTGPFVDSGSGIPATIFDAKGDLIAASAADTAARLAAGANGTRLVADSTQTTGLRWAAGLAVRNQLTSGDVTISATTNVVGSSVTGLGDITLAAVAGDFIECGLSAIANNTTANSMKFDVCTVVAAAAVNFFSNGTGTGATNGVMAWYLNTGIIGKSGGSIIYAAQAGDLSGGNVVLRLTCFVSAGTRVLGAQAALPLIFWARNLGQ